MEKCCAGGVLDRSIKQLGYALPERTIQKEIHGVKIFHGEQSFDFRCDRRISVTVRRRDFDRFLVDLAEKQGAEIIMDKKCHHGKDGRRIGIGFNWER